MGLEDKADYLVNSGSLDHRAALQEPSSLMFVDVELVEQAMAHQPQYRVDGR